MRVGEELPVKFSLMREFVKLADTKNFTRAAEELYIAQPVLSRHMAQLEEEIGVKLIRRTRNSFELTPAGRIAQQEFQKLLDHYANTLDALSRLEAAQQGELHLGFLYYDRDYYVAKIREVMRKRYPNVKLNLHSYQPAQLERDLLDGKIDAAMIYGANGCERGDIRYMPFLRIPYWLIVDHSHALAGRDNIQIGDLDGQALLYPREQLEICHCEKPLMEAFQQNGVRIANVLPIDNFDEVSWLLGETGAVYISPMANPTAYAGDTTCIPMPEMLQSDISLVWRADRNNPAVHMLCSAIKACYS